MNVLKLLGKSLENTFSGYLWKYLLGGIGSLFGILLFAKNLLGSTSKDSVIYGLVFLFIVLILRYILFLCVNTAKYIHNIYVEAIYGEAIISLKDAYSKVHHLRKLDAIEDGAFKDTMTYFCNTLKKIFDKKTNADCSVSIKVPVNSDIKDLECAVVYNLCRDTGHFSRDTEQYKAISHTIIGNTPYRYIVNNILRGNNSRLFYVNNNIDVSQGYENTSKEAYQHSTLPYKSEFVYPIIPIINSNNNLKMLGFICIDCSEKNGFNDIKYDIAMIEGVSDGIYDIMKKKLLN